MKVKLDHIGILVKALDDDVIGFYQQALGCEKPKYFHVKNKDEEIGYAYLPFARGDNFIELSAPIRGSMKEALDKNGQGTMFEVCVEVENMKAFYLEMKERNIILRDSNGRPLPKEKPWCSVPGDDNKYAYLPTDKTFGTTIELLERNTWTRETYWPQSSKPRDQTPESSASG